MAQPEVWFSKNDMLMTLSGLRSSTMSTGSYLTNSTNLSVSVWKGLTTGSTSTLLIFNRNMAYEVASNGNYRATAQSTETTALTNGTRGVAIMTLNHQGLNGEWRLPFRVEYRRTT